LQIVEIDGPELMKSAVPYFIYPGYAFVSYPNRDSTVYKTRYQIPEAETVVRGTLRYQGFPEFVKVLVDIGFLSDEPKEYLSPDSKIAWKDAFAKVLGSSSSAEE
jgi:saccharopine dehydrogenase (NADP+, L-glutamate forming)